MVFRQGYSVLYFFTYYTEACTQLTPQITTSDDSGLIINRKYVTHALVCAIAQALLYITASSVIFTFTYSYKTAY